ncbi:MAG: hypothetical protein ACLR3T_00080 [Alistipes finegoldii]
MDYKQYEGQIQKLIDTHIESGEVITDLVNIFDKERFAEEVEKISEKSQSRHDASRTAKYITENMDTDPALQEVLADAQGEDTAIRTRANRRGI